MNLLPSSRGSRLAFSLIELLVALALLAIIAALIIPRYVGLRRQALIRIAEQQTDAVQKAVLAWMGSQPSISAAEGVWGSLATPSNNAITAIRSYLDTSFANKVTFSGGGFMVSTPQMQEITGFNNYSPSTSSSSSYNGKYVAFATLLWSPSNRRTTQPQITLYIPSDTTAPPTYPSGGGSGGGGSSGKDDENDH